MALEMDEHLGGTREVRHLKRVMLALTVLVASEIDVQSASERISGEDFFCRFDGVNRQTAQLRCLDLRLNRRAERYGQVAMVETTWTGKNGWKGRISCEYRSILCKRFEQSLAIEIKHLGLTKIDPRKPPNGTGAICTEQSNDTVYCFY